MWAQVPATPGVVIHGKHSTTTPATNVFTQSQNIWQGSGKTLVYFYQELLSGLCIMQIFEVRNQSD